MSEPHAIRVSVGELARIVQWGDIHYRFTRSSTATEGIRGHQLVQRRRGDAYEREVAVSRSFDAGDITLDLHGRADGCETTDQGFLIEEIKTTRTAFADIPAYVVDIHRAQVRLYGALLMTERDIDSATLQLCYYHLDDGNEHLSPETWTREEAETFLEDLMSRYLDRIRARLRWRRERDASIQSLDFPFADYRSGQRDLSVAVYRAVTARSALVMQAPTGTGKTMGTIFPAIKALPELDDGKDGRLFYLSARTAGQELARDAVASLTDAGLALRSVTLTAKDKVCFLPGTPCDPEFCEYARGYYDRNGDAIADLIATDRHLDREEISTVAATHTVCPFELSLDVATSCDLVVCDYNYVFDPWVYLRRFFDEESGHVLLLDEGHNLVSRAREMFSASVSKQAVLAARREIVKTEPAIARALNRVNRVFLDLRFDGDLEVAELPEAKLLKGLRGFTDAMEQRLAEGFAASDEVLTLYFEALRYLRTAELVNDAYRSVLTQHDDMVAELFCINPAGRLGEVWEKVAATVCFSATLQPRAYYGHLLGLPDEANWYSLASPFESEHLGVVVAGHVATSYRRRDASLPALVATIHTVITARAGNYLVFFPSYAYLSRTLAEFEATWPHIPVKVQQAGMSDDDRALFLSEFEPSGQVVGFAVMGGAFSEAIDLVGDRLIGCVVVGVGLPQLEWRNNLIRDYFDERGNEGFDFAYRYPGFTRVLQTAGRVIRTADDKGVVCLVDERYQSAEYRQLFPAHWQVQYARATEEVRSVTDAFWARALPSE